MARQKHDPATLVDVLQQRICEDPARVAYTFCEDGEIEDGSLSYGQLDTRAREIAAWLQQTTTVGDRVLLVLPPGLDYIAAFMGCIYAGALAVPTYPPGVNHQRDIGSRFRVVLQDACPAIGLTTASLLERLKPLIGADSEIAKVRWETINSVAAPAAYWVRPALGPETLAFLQYTSGSTTVPRGVMVSHGNLLANERAIQAACNHSSESTFVGWLPLYHDMGLIGNVLQPLFTGARSILMPPAAFLQRPMRWLRAISHYRAYTSGAPNFAYDLCVRRATDAELEGVDLSSWEVAFNGAEPVRDGTLERFSARFASYGFRPWKFFPCYGLAEATLMVSGGPHRTPPVMAELSADCVREGHAVSIDEKPGPIHRLVGCGKPLPEQEIAIVHPENLSRCAPGTIGEIWISGPCVAQGYWNQPEVSNKVFCATIAGDDKDRQWLRTGDLGILRTGILFVTGRLKELIIIRGRNYYPQDIELTVEQSSLSLRRGCGACFTVSIHDEEALVLVQEVERDSMNRANTLIETIRAAVTMDHGLQAHAIVLVKPGGVPKTTSGKIRRNDCRQSFLEDALPVVAASIAGADEDEAADEKRHGASAGLRTELSQQRSALVERYLLQALSRVLRREVQNIRHGVLLAELGLDSLAAVDLSHILETEMQVSVSSAELLGTTKLSDLLRLLSEAVSVPLVIAGDDPPVSASGELSFGQRALWYLHQLAPYSSAYNLCGTFRLGQNMRVSLLRECFQTLINRHAALRTTFYLQNGEPRQRICDTATVSFHEIAITGCSDTELTDRIQSEADRPFDLEQGPLFRVNVFDLADGSCVLQIVFHHLIGDFWSVEVLLTELGDLYSARAKGIEKTLPPPGRPYHEWLQAQTAMLTSKKGEQLRNYWRTQLTGIDGEISTFEIPADRRRPAVQTYAAGFYSFQLPRGLDQRLHALSSGYGVTPFMLYASVFQLFLHRWSNQAEVRMGCPMACRQQSRFSRTIGYFANLVMLKSTFSEDDDFEKFLGAFRRTVLEASQHQEYPYSLVVEMLRPVRSSDRDSLAPAMFVWQQAHLTGDAILAVLGLSVGRITLGSLELETMELSQRGAQTDITLTMGPGPSGVCGMFTYNSDLFLAEAIKNAADWFIGLLENVATNPREKICNIDFMPRAEVNRRIAEWSPESEPMPAVTLQELIEKQVGIAPDLPAVSFLDQHLSYGELNRRANRLARSLKRYGAGPDAIVGICMERSLELPLILLAVLKAGGAYLPLDPDYPNARLCHMVTQAHARLVISTESLRNRLVGVPCRSFDFEDLVEESRDQSDSNLETKVYADNPAYVIFTSGSTGQPKGAMNTHRGIVNRLVWMQKRYGLGPAESVLHKTPFGFDVSVWEFFWPLISGARIVVARPEGHRDPDYLANLIVNEQISTVHFVPAMLRTFLDAGALAGCRCLRRVISSGEKLSTQLHDDFFACSGAELHNLYGPTEAAIDVTAWECSPKNTFSDIPIGTAIENLRIYIVDRYLQLRPPKAAGHLCIAGAGLARGYVGSPELTAERFIPDPFSDREGERLYVTGDLASYRNDGVIEFIGRMDSQIKIRGFRIELEEIEATLRQCPSIKDCVVVVQDTSTIGARLIAYVVCDPAETVTLELRRYMAERLPSVMVPAMIVKLDCLPLNRNGKVDRKALPVADFFESPEDESQLPSTPIEKELAGLWSRILGVPSPRTNDNFFDQGGHSLLAMRLLSAIRDTFHVTMPLSVFFGAVPTLGMIAENIETLIIEDTDPEIVKDTLSNMSHLS